MRESLAFGQSQIFGGTFAGGPVASAGAACDVSAHGAPTASNSFPTLNMSLLCTFLLSVADATSRDAHVASGGGVIIDAAGVISG